VTAPARGARRLAGMVFPTATPFRWGLWTRRYAFPDSYDWLSSSAVAAPVQWAARTFPEAPPKLWKEDEQGREEPVRRHDVLRLLRRPNPFFTGPLLWMATVTDWMVNSDAYWRKVRSPGGIPVELWWLPSWMVEPNGDGSDLVTEYVYTVDGVEFTIPPADIVHFKYGADPENPRKGMSPLRSVIREVVTDEEAATFTATLLRNMGVPGLVISPAKGAPAPNADDVAATKDYMRTAFSGENRGEPLVMSGATEVSSFGFSPEQLVLRELRRIPEERVTAVTGIPAIVAGLGAGLDRSTFTNMGEAREAAYEGGLIPMQRILAEEVLFQLVTDFVAKDEVLDSWHFGFDLSKVRVLQEDQYRIAQRHDLAVRGGWEMVAEARRGMGLEVEDDRDNIFIRQINTYPVDGDGAPTAPASTSNGNGNSSNGNGHVDQALVAAVAAELARELDRRELTNP
jgi:HK97 family phage portal protein